MTIDGSTVVINVSAGRAGGAAGGACTVRELIDDATRRLSTGGVPSARLDAELLLAHVLRTGRTSVHTRPQTIVDEPVVNMFEGLLRRRSEREPLAYIVGTKEFWSLDFEVTPDVLIPRPETERLVELTVGLLRGSAVAPSICEIGTGSGCIAVALARELETASIVAADISPAAIAVAQRNATRHGVTGRIELVCSDLFGALQGRRFDVVVSNPPYVAAGEIAKLAPELRCEPELALDGGADGLDIVRRLLGEAAGYLVPGGSLLIEIGAMCGDAVADLARLHSLVDINVVADYAGLPRVLVARAG